MKHLVSIVSMVTVFWVVTYSWRSLGKQSKHGHLVLSGGGYIYVVTIFKLLFSSRFNVFYNMRPLVIKVTVFWAVTDYWRTIG